MRIFGLAIFLGAFLLFLVQPLVGKALLPWFGGTPAVWATCMLFFQSALLVGYAAAHLLFARLSSSAQRRVYVGLLAAGALLLLGLGTAWPSPVTPGSGWAPEANELPIARLLLLLLISCGLPYIALSAASPLLQSWFAAAHPDRSPYALYALSNTGSLGALLAFPFIIEPTMTVSGSGWLWSAGFVAFLVAAALCARVAVVAEPSAPSDDAPTEDASVHPAWWFALALGGSLLLLGTTNQLTEEIAVAPLLWIAPLALYLASMILAFAGDEAYRRRTWLPQGVLAAVLLAGLLEHHADYRSAAPQLVIYLYAMTVGCVLCHGELARLKPAPSRLTSFYLWMSAGGAAGGLLIGVGAPLLLPASWELHLTLAFVGPLLLLALLRDPASALARGHWLFAPFVLFLGTLVVGYAVRSDIGVPIAAMLGDMAISYAALVVAAAIALGRFGRKLDPRPLWGVALGALLLLPMYGALLGDAAGTFRAARHVSRNFYGVLRILEGKYHERPVRIEVHGEIKHGLELLDADGGGRVATSYFGVDSGLGRAIAEHPRRRAGKPLHVGVIGLGVGTVAALVGDKERIRFYEINPEVIRLAGADAAHFTFLSPARKAGVTVDVVPGDARLSLAREQRQNFDIFVVDAFTGGAVPAHLLTREAIDLYLSHMRDKGGILAFHISNHYLDLTPVLLGAVKRHGLTARMLRVYSIERWLSRSDWMLLSRDPAALGHPRLRNGPDETIERPLDMSRAREWTDDFSNLLGLIRWWPEK